jgi:uncharacterized Zn finger protein (UPF0148 family)
MSELLLKGATMTNRHCDTCGDPIFRYQGQEFCPTCQNASVDGGPDSVQDDADAQATPAAESAADAASDGTNDDASVPVEPASPDDGGVAADPRQQAAPDTSVSASPDRQQAATPDDQYPGATPDTQHAATTPDNRQATTPASPTGAAEEPQQAPLAGDAADLDTARASLVRTVTRYSREAESADDPRRARELLSVAHEAAETLAALDRTR